MSQNLQNFVKFQKFQLENLVDFEKCCKTHIFLQKSEPIQPKTSNILPKFCQPTLSDVSAGCASGAGPRCPARLQHTAAGNRRSNVLEHAQRRSASMRVLLGQNYDTSHDAGTNTIREVRKHFTSHYAGTHTLFVWFANILRASCEKDEPAEERQSLAEGERKLTQR